MRPVVADTVKEPLDVPLDGCFVPVEGWFVDKYGPKVVVLFGGALCGIGWVINAYAGTLGMFYLGQIVAGIGAGAVYGTCVGNALKWFPDRRGLAAGITAAGFGVGWGMAAGAVGARRAASS